METTGSGVIIIDPGMSFPVAASTEGGTVIVVKTKEDSELIGAVG